MLISLSMHERQPFDRAKKEEECIHEYIVCIWNYYSVPRFSSGCRFAEQSKLNLIPNPQ